MTTVTRPLHPPDSLDNQRLDVPDSPHGPTAAGNSRGNVSLPGDPPVNGSAKQNAAPLTQVRLAFPWASSDDGRQVSYQGRSLQLRIASQGRALVDGSWDHVLHSHGKAIPGDSNWEEVCRYEDEDVDYLELELSLARGLRLQRQLFVARRDAFMFLADAILAPRALDLEYTMKLKTPDNVRWEAATETRESFLRSQARSALLLPLALPEWRSESSPGELRGYAGGLEYSLQRPSRRLFVPLFLDLQLSRFRRPITWRRLTVAENLVIQPAEVAVGYRVQIGAEQWLFYRSLAPCANRSVLGHNLATEFLCGRFGREGVVDKIMEVIGPEE